MARKMAKKKTQIGLKLLGSTIYAKNYQNQKYYQTL